MTNDYETLKALAFEEEYLRVYIKEIEPVISSKSFDNLVRSLKTLIETVENWEERLADAKMLQIDISFCLQGIEKGLFDVSLEFDRNYPELVCDFTMDVKFFQCYHDEILEFLTELM
jgi:hypothetical protein